MLKRNLLCVVLVLSISMISQAAIIVAASNSLPEEKAKADIVCDGKDDQVELLASITKANKFDVVVDMNPGAQQTVKCYGRHAVEWLPGDYYLSKTLMIPDAADMVIDAEGTYFHYLPKEGSAVCITGMNRCRYNFGTVKTNTTGAAILVQPTVKMPALMSVIKFQGLIGNDQKGVGLHLDHRYENVCVNNFVGTDIYGFDVGILVDDIMETMSEQRPTCKSDTNWYWFTYIRLCNTCIWEKGHGVDCGHWEVNVDASLPGSTAIRTSGAYTQWKIIMGTWNLDKSHAFILEPGSQHQIIQMRPPIDVFRWQNNSGNDTNVFLMTSRLPYRDAPDAEILTYWNRAGGVPGQHEQRKIELQEYVKNKKVPK